VEHIGTVDVLQPSEQLQNEADKSKGKRPLSSESNRGRKFAWLPSQYHVYTSSHVKRAEQTTPDRKDVMLLQLAHPVMSSRMHLYPG
jgi:hypothetical protein